MVNYKQAITNGIDVTDGTNQGSHIGRNLREDVKIADRVKLRVVPFEHFLLLLSTVVTMISIGSIFLPHPSNIAFDILIGLGGTLFGYDALSKKIEL